MRGVWSVWSLAAPLHCSYQAAAAAVESTQAQVRPYQITIRIIMHHVSEIPVSMSAQCREDDDEIMMVEELDHKKL